MIGGKGSSRHVHDPITELVVTLRDNAAPLTVKVVAYIKGGVAAITVTGEVWGL